MSKKDLVHAIEVGSINTATFDAEYLPFFTNGLPEACFMLRFTNASSKIVYLKYEIPGDGVINTCHDVIINGQTITLDFQTNNQGSNHVALMAKGVKILAHGDAGVGFVYCAGYYQK